MCMLVKFNKFFEVFRDSHALHVSIHVLANATTCTFAGLTMRDHLLYNKDTFLRYYFCNCQQNYMNGSLLKLKALHGRSLLMCECASGVLL